LAAVMVGVLPGRLASLSKPGKPFCRNRLRHRPAFWLLIFMAAAISKSCFPSAARRMICARWTWRMGKDRDLVHCSKVFRCSLSSGPVHLRSIAELSPSSMAGRIHLHSGGTGVMDVLTAVTTAEGD
jgi:hypothetical protein